MCIVYICYVKQPQPLSHKYMRTKEQLEKLINTLQAELEALPKVPERWRADRLQKYYTIYSDNTVDTNKEFSTHGNDEHYDAFNYYRTLEEAARIAKVQLAYRTLDLAMSGMEKYDNGYIFCIDQLNKFEIGYRACIYNPLPKLKFQSDCEHIIATYPNELRTFLTGGRE